LKKQPTDLRRNPRDLGDGTLARSDMRIPENEKDEGRGRVFNLGILHQSWSV
jgi:hypothetical protein